MKIAILGFGREGQSILNFLRKSPDFKNSEVWVLDRNRLLKIPRGVVRRGSPQVKSRLGKDYLKDLSGFDLVLRSPGLPYNLPTLQKARLAGTEFSSATKLFFEKCPGKIVGITGTKGKSTAATLIYRMLKAAGRKVFFGGNIGRSMLDILPKIKKGSLVVLELSSFQLQDLKNSPQVAVALDVFPDHQDSHLDLNEYYGAKANIARHQRKGDKIFFFKNSPKSRWIAKKSKGRRIAVDEKRFGLFGHNDLKIGGAHSFRNAVMATKVAVALGVPAKTASRVAKNFRGLEHRLEFTGKIGPISFYNDSASTNPHASAAAIKSFSGEPKILIAGGQDKKLAYGPLASVLKGSDTGLVVLFGENKTKIKKQISDSRVPTALCNNLRSAVKKSYEYAKKIAADCQLPVIVLFSPGATSFDQFKNYADRGKQFKKIVRRLTKDGK